MKKIILLSLGICSIVVASAQKDAKKITAYAITAVQKGASNWTEVRLIDVTSGEEVQTVFKSADEAEILSARTGKPVVKKDATANKSLITPTTPALALNQVTVIEEGKNININTNAKSTTNSNINTNVNTIVHVRGYSSTPKQAYDQPFATNSAACAYDKKHNRLYYTPMGINQLRYIDLKAKSPKVFYFEDEAFGVVKGRGDVAGQITRMVMGSDGNGYALSNDGNHLLQFTTKKNPVITDLGPLTDDLTNGRFSVHSSANYGGDMIADKQGNLYLVVASRAVYKISIESKVASYVGAIKGLPRGFSTNGAIAEGDSKVIVSSSSNTEGYYHFDLNTLQAEKVSGAASVFNASDLANGMFAFEKKNKEEEKPTEEKQETITTSNAKTVNPLTLSDAVVKNAITIFPNPVTEGFFKLSFGDQKPGRYQVQLMDAAGKIISSQAVNIAAKIQVEEFRIPQQVAAGNYIVKVISEDGTYSNTSKIIVQ